MSWVSIDYHKCTHCGICVLRCERCFTKKKETISVQADAECCNLCGHCVSLCPTGAIVHHKMDMDNFPDIDEPVTFQPEEFIQFIRERRSHRHFRRKHIPKKALEKLIDAVRYAPTASNEQNVEIMVVENPDRIRRLSQLTVEHFDHLGACYAAKLEKINKEGEEIPENITLMQNVVRYRERMLQVSKKGLDPIFHGAPAVIIFHSTTQSAMAQANCVIASTTMGLLARTMGLETTYIGFFETASKFYQPLIEELSLPEGHKVFSVLIAGYPKLNYLRTVDRRPIKTRWE
ncbi:MAG: nitroreductase family protein [Deltaproteobacteria bacterium]|nr:MAG: nitroreductase family protein [Deltaproteobacteria bacterium]